MFTNKQMYTNVHKLNWWLTGVLLVIGMGIFFFSLYNASLTGLRIQLGLIGGDLVQTVDNNKLYRGVIEVGSIPSCNYMQTILPIARYTFAKDLDKILLGRELARKRVECAIVYTLQGNVERGVYTLLKALRYKSAELLYMSNLTDRGNIYCRAYQTDATYGYIEAYIEASSGAVHGIVLRTYEEVQRLGMHVLEKCSN